MKNMRGIILGILIIFLLALPAFSQQHHEFKDLASITETMFDSLMGALPFNSTVGLNWSDAFIGQIPPHFGIGVSAGYTTVDFNSISNLVGLFSRHIPYSDNDFHRDMGFPLIAYTAEFRLGGIIVPIDIGFKFGFLKPDFSQNLTESIYASSAGFKVNYMLIGGDFRYAFIDKKVFPLKLSFGVGLNYLDGGIGLPPQAYSDSITFEDTAKGIELKHSIPQLDINWNTFNIEMKTQVSFPFQFITPYAGAGLGYAISEAKFIVKTDDVELNGLEVTDLANVAILEILKDDYNITEVSKEGYESVRKFTSFNMRLFGGFSFNLVYIRLDITGMFNILSKDYGATVGVRFQQ